jgi:hypothetical protein
VTEEEKKAYAEYVIRQHAKDVEYLSIHEMFEDYTSEQSILSDTEADEILTLIKIAKLEVSW